MNDRQLRQDILDVFQWDPRIQAAHIGVVVEHGVATLTGQVVSEDERLATEEAARHVEGVRAVRQQIKVQPAPNPSSASDDLYSNFATD